MDFDKSLKMLIYNAVRENSDLIWRIENCEDHKDLLKYINSTEGMKKFYREIDEEKSQEELFKIVKEITTKLANEDDFKKNVVTLMEYMRVNVSYENVSTRAGKLSQSARNCAILGKGVCAGQSEYFNILLRSAGMKSYVVRRNFEVNTRFSYACPCVRC